MKTYRQGDIKAIKSRNLQFSVFIATLLLIFYKPVRELVSFSLSSPTYSYHFPIPLVTIYFLFHQRKKIFANINYSIRPGCLVVAIGLAIFFIGSVYKAQLPVDDYLSQMTISMVVILIGGFIFFFGIDASRRALFPLCFLFFMAPLPTLLLTNVTWVLQVASAEATNLILMVTRVPYHREGLIFSLSNLDFIVAKECSGIRSGLILIMTSLVFGQLCLRTNISRIFLTLSVFPITVFKNGLRIVTLTLFGNYVSEKAFSGPLHAQGGILVFVVAIIFLAVVTRFLQNGEREIGAAE